MDRERKKMMVKHWDHHSIMVSNQPPVVNKLDGDQVLVLEDLYELASVTSEMWLGKEVQSFTKDSSRNENDLTNIYNGTFQIDPWLMRTHSHIWPRINALIPLWTSWDTWWPVPSCAKFGWWRDFLLRKWMRLIYISGRNIIPIIKQYCGVFLVWPLPSTTKRHSSVNQ